MASAARHSSTPASPSEALWVAFQASGLLRTQVAEAIGVDQQIIRYLNRGRVSLATADKLFVYFGLSIESYPGVFSEALRAAMKASGKSGLTIASESGLGEAAIYRLLRGEPGTRLATADKLFVYFGLRLSIAGETVKRSNRTERPTLPQIQAAMKAIGLGTTELSRKSNVSTCTIQLIKSGSPRVNLKDVTLAKLASALGIDWEPAYPFSLPIKTPVASVQRPVEPAAPAPDSFDPIELAKLSDQQSELVLLINSQEPQGASGPWIGAEFKLTSYRYHLKNIAKISEYWRTRIDFPANPGEPYHVRIN